MFRYVTISLMCLSMCAQDLKGAFRRERGTALPNI